MAVDVDELELAVVGFVVLFAFLTALSELGRIAHRLRRIDGTLRASSDDVETPVRERRLVLDPEIDRVG